MPVWITTLAALVAAVPVGAVDAKSHNSSSPSSTRTVECSEIALGVSSGRAGGYRIVRGAVSVPPAYHRQVVRTADERWPYFRKAGLGILAGRGQPISVAVAKGWRNRVAISWGNNTDRAFALVRFARCAKFRPPKSWNVYAGGFFLRSPSACVPLTFRVGRRTTVLRFGLGERCAARL